MTKADQPYSVLLQQALGLQQAGRRAEAEPLYRKVLQLSPGQPDALHLLGLLCKDTGRIDEAEKLMRLSLEASPRQPHVLNNLANLLGNLGRREEALVNYRRATTLAPQYSDAWRNLGLTLIDDDRAAEAVPALETAAKLSPGHGETLLGLGIALIKTGDLDRAIAIFQNLLAQQPGHARALHNLGVALNLKKDYRAAAEAFDLAAKTDPGRAETRLALGNAYASLGEHDKAATAYRAATLIAPGYREAHQNLSKLLWRTGAANEFLASYPKAIKSAPKVREIRADYAAFLLQSGHNEKAEAVLEAALATLGDDAALWRLMGRVLTNLGRPQEAHEAFKRAAASGPANIEVRNDFARFLIAAGDYEAAARELDAVEKIAPLDQQMWAYRCLNWRLKGDPRAKWLEDTDNFVKPLRLCLPEGYSDFAAFNLTLKHELEQLHRTKVHPIDQSLKGGTQTEGKLFDEKNPVIQAFRQSLELSVADFIKSLPEDANHPFLCRKSKDFNFSGSWSIRLHEGHHINHIHPEGWISSAYYVSLPEAVTAAGETQEGWIKFGESNLALKDREEIARIIQPEEGLLVLFPSYMWHGTIPFSGDAARLTIAFDIVPA
jgi:tetratricopeptide (TPR) repeat protein